jgi:hypothetical protein
MTRFVCELFRYFVPRNPHWKVMPIIIPGHSNCWLAWQLDGRAGDSSAEYRWIITYTAEFCESKSEQIKIETDQSPFLSKVTLPNPQGDNLPLSIDSATAKRDRREWRWPPFGSTYGYILVVQRPKTTSSRFWHFIKVKFESLESVLCMLGRKNGFIMRQRSWTDRYHWDLSEPVRADWHIFLLLRIEFSCFYL